MIKRIFPIAVFFFLVCSISTAKASTTVDVHKDGYIEDFTRSPLIPPDGIPDRISDTNALLASRGIFSDFNVDSRAIMTFDISTYAGQHLTSAFLTGYGTRVDNAGSFDPISGQFYLYSGDGVVGMNDFNSAATHVGSANFQADPSGFNLSLFQIDITSSLQHLLANSDHYAEFRVQTDSPTVFINAGETDPSSFFSVDPRWPGPKLVFNTDGRILTPEPGSLILFGVGSAFLGGILSRRKHEQKQG